MEVMIGRGNFVAEFWNIKAIWAYLVEQKKVPSPEFYKKYSHI
jgi:hypothetical protein